MHEIDNHAKTPPAVAFESGQWLPHGHATLLMATTSCDSKSLDSADTKCSVSRTLVICVVCLGALVW